MFVSPGYSQRRFPVALFVSSLLALLSSGAVAWAMSLDSATLRVTVLDPAGAVVTSSHVIVKLSGGAEQAHETDQSGQTIFNGLIAGRCEIHVEAPGFVA